MAKTVRTSRSVANEMRLEALRAVDAGRIGCPYGHVVVPRDLRDRLPRRTFDRLLRDGLAESTGQGERADLTLTEAGRARLAAEPA